VYDFTTIGSSQLDGFRNRKKKGKEQKLFHKTGLAQLIQQKS
jgi:hypothetical protein